ncbi:MAG: radical SAM protein, partial [Oscillospiraceae bacterium]|nr:radical SAM protein [Oscillospiraceae bacterium]
MERVSRLNAEYTDATGRTRAYFVDCYGCQQNEADAETMRGMLHEMGYAPAQDEKQADIVLLNTCAVREHAEMRVLGNVGALSHCKKANPEMIIGVGGCMTQQESMAEKLKKSFPYVDLVFGTHALWRLPEMVYRRLVGTRRIFDIENEDGRIAEGLPIQRKDNIRGWVSVMYGCNNFCSYCIVPYVRGRERSRRPEDVLREVQGLLDAGCREINLLGQNVNSYGKNTDFGVDFPDLLR